VLAQLDNLAGIERSYCNHTGDMVRISLTARADPETVVDRVLEVLAKEARSPIRLTGPDLSRALNHELWRQSDQVGELSRIEYRTLGLSEVRKFAESENLNKETSDKLIRIAVEEWDRMSKEHAASTPQLSRTIDGARQFRLGAKAMMNRAKSDLTAEQIDRLRERLNRRLEVDGHALGTVDFPITCSAQARVEFNRAIALLHHMSYPQARAAFERVATVDPGCAMAHWGIAMTLFQPLWPTRPDSITLRRGWEAVQKAKALQPPTERERLFVAAAEAFFLEPTSSDYWLRIRRWEQAMETLLNTFPDDPEAAAFYALAHLATAPPDTITRAHSDRAAEILRRVYQKNPNHPGAMHYLVHANDVPGRERELLDVTRKYEAVAPGNPHAIHMPTHIYTRLGDWNGVIRGNLRAAQAALDYPSGANGEWVSDEFAHAIEYLIYADLQKGADDRAATQLKRLHATVNLEPTFKTAFHLMSTQARFALERRAWGEAAQIVPREPATLDWNRFTWPEAIAQFARGLGASHLGKLNDARVAAARLEELESATRKAGEDLFARNIRMLRLELNGWLAHLAGQEESSIALLKEAADLEVGTPKHAVTPGPTLPAQELFGDLFMEQKQPAKAFVAYQRSLELYPKRFNGLLGAARAARALDNESSARRFYRELLEVADGGSRQPALKEAQNYVGKRR
jgi:tetratricopeptide (TPR) repeat protein